MIKRLLLALSVAFLFTLWISTNGYTDAHAGSVAASEHQQQSGHIYSVQVGDSLTRIAQRLLGDQARWREILEATNEKAATEGAPFITINNPAILRPEQRLWIPSDAVDEPDSCLEISQNQRVALLPRVGDGGLWGYVDETNTFVIEPSYQIAGDFVEGFAAVSVDGLRYDYINPSNEMMRRRARFGVAGDFSEGLAPVRTVSAVINRYGFVDCHGDVKVRLKYLSVWPFRNGVARAIGINDGEFYLTYLDRDGNETRTEKLPITIEETLTRKSVSVDGLERRDNLSCTQPSAYGDHPALFQCTTDETSNEQGSYDPCFLEQGNSEIVCGYPHAPFVVEADTTEAANNVEQMETELILENHWLWLAHSDPEQIGEFCWRLPVHREIERRDEVYTFTYECSDGLFVLDSDGSPPFTLGLRSSVYPQQATVIRSQIRDDRVNPRQFTTIPVLEVQSFSTSLDDSGGGKAAIGGG